MNFNVEETSTMGTSTLSQLATYNLDEFVSAALPHTQELHQPSVTLLERAKSAYSKAFPLAGRRLRRCIEEMCQTPPFKTQESGERSEEGEGDDEDETQGHTFSSGQHGEDMAYTPSNNHLVQQTG